ncbi:MAG: hypothetical protein H7039_23395 [Bryobacteraceae bacterium]|nr:hypothetical protein [Bryobacteraceae bacterium]
MRTSGLLFLLSLTLFGQGTETKRAATEFPVQASLPGAQLGAEFMVRLISYGRESFVSDNFLVVEVALYPDKGSQIVIRPNEFTLRVNGKKELLTPQAPQAVAMSISYPAWESNPNAGAERFPGDPRARPMPGPPAPSVAAPEVEQKRLSPTEVITRSALPEGPRKTLASGYLFFPWRGNPARLKTVEMMVTPESGSPVTVRLR